MAKLDFPRKTNLYDRKRSVLKIAKENFTFVQRLQNVRSELAKYNGTSGRSTPNRSRPSSALKSAYPNIIQPP